MKVTGLPARCWRRWKQARDARLKILDVSEALGPREEVNEGAAHHLDPDLGGEDR
jgi:hypothetical protein